ncbi:MAG: AraC family transcriptional regulator [Eubacteriales bacterium]|nr:AraC family transcriptional regulator [Eubacteriales bacterium]
MNYYCEIITREKFIVENGSHEKNAIFIILEGKFECCFSGVNYPVGKNKIVIFNKKSFFKRKVLNKLRCIYIQFDDFPLKLENGLVNVEDTVRLENTTKYMEKAIIECNEKLIKHYIDDIFILLSNTEKSFKDIITSACIDYIAKNYTNKITLDDLSSKTFVSKQTIIDKFNKNTKMTPMMYIQKIRLDKSKYLLVNSDLTIGEIAENIGFDNIYYFSNTFKKFFGISPLQYRKKFSV